MPYSCSTKSHSHCLPKQAEECDLRLIEGYRAALKRIAEKNTIGPFGSLGWARSDAVLIAQKALDEEAPPANSMNLTEEVFNCIYSEWQEETKLLQH